MGGLDYKITENKVNDINLSKNKKKMEKNRFKKKGLSYVWMWKVQNAQKSDSFIEPNTLRRHIKISINTASERS